MLVGISDDTGDAGQGGNLLWRALGITAGHDNPAFGILATNAANAGACVPVGRGSNRAGIQNDDLGVLCIRHPLESVVTQLSLYSGAVCLGRSTAKILYVKACHSNIVT